MPAATATSRQAPPAPKILKQRRALVEELLGLHVKYKDAFARIDAIEAALKTIATDTDSFKEEVAGKGHVSVSGAVPKEYKGEVPQIVTEAWGALKESERKQHLKSGLIAMVAQWSKASYGRVTVKIF